MLTVSSVHYQARTSLSRRILSQPLVNGDPYGGRSLGVVDPSGRALTRRVPSRSLSPTRFGFSSALGSNTMTAGVFKAGPGGGPPDTDVTPPRA